jgi:hypothetical protein
MIAFITFTNLRLEWLLESVGIKKGWTLFIFNFIISSIITSLGVPNQSRSDGRPGR